MNLVNKPRINERRNNRVAVGVSGGGRSLANFLAEQSKYRYQIAGVIASKPGIGAIDIAKKAMLPVLVEDFSSKNAEAAAKSVYDWLASNDIGWIALAGFLKPFPLLDGWERRIVNIHPALLPAFGGKGMYGDHVHRAVIAAKAIESGPTIHYVDARYDEGEIIEQARVAVKPDDTPELLAARVFQAECALYPAVLDRLVGGSQA